MRISLGHAGLLLLLLAAGGGGYFFTRWLVLRAEGVSSDAAEAGAPSSGYGSAADALAAGEGASPRFTDVTRASRIDFRHENGSVGEYQYPEIMGGGVALFDADGDGLLDVYLVNGNNLVGPPSPQITNRLYRNAGDGTFRDVTERAGVGDPSFGQGCCAADYDSDGDLDLYVSNYGPNRLYRNEGDGTFREVGAAAGVADPGWGQTCSFLDADGDGDLDLYAQNYLEFSLEIHAEAYLYLGNRRVRDYPAPRAFPGTIDHLYRNDGEGTFTDVTESSGLASRRSKGMGAACFDFDDDGDTDIVVACDGEENLLWRNRGDGTFEEVGLELGIAYDNLGVAEASMGIATGDYDGDGRLDLAIPSVQQQIFALYRNLGSRFTDASWKAGLAQSTSDLTGFNANFLDVDGDGDLDLFFTAGGVRMNEIQGPEVPFEKRYGLPDRLLVNDGEGHYRDVSASAGPHFARRLVSRGSATGDLDNDGDLDLVVTNLAGPALVLRNDTRGGHWLTLKLEPASGAAEAIGAGARLTVGGRTLRRVVHPHVTYLSQDDRRLHFGLGDKTRAERLEVRWPSGGRQVLEDIAADQILVVREAR